MKFFIEERLMCYIEADNEDEALRYYYKNKSKIDTDSDIDIEEVQEFGGEE